ncbi:DUF3089 domain-containing protein [Sphingomonas sp. Leaf25]|uniref:DUF3089 domain-containing protein n=1 Tax=Sphingomonas sp. Leaf25 TaxID=1735692 RepID=UPI0006FCAB2E|nr:DUF3089 domain-containing protein [Sphingomonas sp. Leaf25]KQM98113.1 hypothetical protein ASE78_07580 [Sphingomonas sp. Leaf25]
MARKFLYVVATLIVLAIVAAFAYRLFGVALLRRAMVPGVAFQGAPAVAGDAYAKRGMWFARPGLTNTPVDWLPPGVARTAPGNAEIFFIHPTSFVGTDRWNAALDDGETNGRAQVFLRGQASAFAAAGRVWAPRYRQATFGAFLTSEGAATQALDLAYRDVAAAFDRFVAEADPKRPIILAGHSQGALHLTRLLREKVAGTRLARRIVAAYVVGWPVSRVTDLAALGLPECRGAEQAGCLLSWQSFADPADPSLIFDTYDATTGFDGRSRAATPMVCTNPLTGTPDAAAPASANLGTLVPDAALTSAVLTPGLVPARCEGRGILSMGSELPDLGPYVLPGNNWHVYDYSLFWANVRADALRRLATWEAAR